MATSRCPPDAVLDPRRPILASITRAEAKKHEKEAIARAEALAKDEARIAEVIAQGAYP